MFFFKQGLLMCVPAILLGVMLSYTGTYIVMGILSDKAQVPFDRHMSAAYVFLLVLVGLGVIFSSYLFPLIKVFLRRRLYFLCVLLLIEIIIVNLGVLICMCAFI
jgi:ABC-type antimicrobial peptide transport system permease subunit